MHCDSTTKETARTTWMALIALASLSSGTIGTAAAADPVPPSILSRAGDLVPTQLVPQLVAPQVDRERVATEDAERETLGLPWRFAVSNPVSIDASEEGLWETTSDGQLVWRLRFRSREAVSLNLGFGRYVMPEGGQLHLYTEDLSQRIRPFTSADNAAHGQLWTPVLPGGSIVVELTIPAGARDELGLEISAVNVGYRGFFKGDGEIDSGSCNVDVVCPQGDGWRDEIPSVAVISIGGGLNCTGFMVNNVAQDETPYFMTARHCGLSSGNAASLVAYWNYETSTCGGTPDGTLNEFNSGSIWRSSYSPSDFTLVELDQLPDPSFGVTYSGWDNSGANASSAIAIHHPSVDEKRISFENQSTSITSYLGTSVPGDGTHVRITDWDEGTTEGGSSGSPVYDQNHRVIGQLHGGFAACGNNDSDWYGALSVSWNGGGTSSTRLRDWLDPGNTGATSVGTLVPGAGCAVNGDCDDGLWCNGSETCNGGGTCEPGADPCPGQGCNEGTQTCTPLTCDNDGTCESGEDCASCSGDCIGGSVASGCGNNVCELGLGEDCISCPSDCNGKQNGKASRQYCCGAGGGTNPVDCADGRCSNSPNTCDSGVASGTYCCGDGSCNGSENSTNCEVDCGPPPACFPVGVSCGSNFECCSNKCKGPGGAQTCR